MTWPAGHITSAIGWHHGIDEFSHRKRNSRAARAQVSLRVSVDSCPALSVTLAAFLPGRGLNKSFNLELGWLLRSRK